MAIIAVVRQKPQPVQRRLITHCALMERIGSTVRLATKQAAKTDLIIQDALEVMALAKHIDLDHPRLHEAIAYLVGHPNVQLRQEKADAILNDPVEDHEKPE